MKLPTFLIADGTLLSVPAKGGAPSTQTAALTVATDEDWLECLDMARRNISNGGRRVEAGQTWEQAIADVAARLLQAGTPDQKWPACGRTPDPVEWEAQSKRWEDLVYAVAALGSAHSARVPDIMPPQFVLTGQVFTAEGWKSLDDVPRSKR